MATNTDAKIIVYTNHRCPWAHRAHIALEELNLPFEEVIIDLDRPRDSWYLQINPRGLVPTLSVDGQIITESGIVSQFLADAYPSHLVPPSDASGGALRRAGIAFFADAFISKVQNWLFKVVNAKTEADQEAISDAVVAAVVQEVEPLLKTAGPFFDGSDKLTLAEVLTGSFVLRIVTFIKAGLYPASMGTGLTEKAPHFWRWAEAVAAHPSVRSIFDEETVISWNKARFAKARAA